MNFFSWGTVLGMSQITIQFWCWCGSRSGSRNFNGIFTARSNVRTLWHQLCWRRLADSECLWQCWRAIGLLHYLTCQKSSIMSTISVRLIWRVVKFRVRCDSTMACCLYFVCLDFRADGAEHNVWWRQYGNRKSAIVDCKSSTSLTITSPPAFTSALVTVGWVAWRVVHENSRLMSVNVAWRMTELQSKTQKISVSVPLCSYNCSIALLYCDTLEMGLTDL